MLLDHTYGTLKTLNSEVVFFKKKTDKITNVSPSLFFFSLEVFPELCTINSNQLSNDSLLLKRTTSPKPLPTTEFNQQQPNDMTQTAMSRGKRWIFVFVVFVYLIISKLIARSTSTNMA